MPFLEDASSWLPFTGLAGFAASSLSFGGGGDGGGGTSTGGDFGTPATTVRALPDADYSGTPARPQPPKAPNSSFAAGFNLLLQDPGAFWDVLIGRVDRVPDAQIKRAAERPVSENLPTIPTWAKVALIGGVVVVGLVAVNSLASKAGA